MRARSPSCCSLPLSASAVLAAALFAPWVRAATLTWDASGTATSTATATDGSGNWNATTLRWNNGVGDQGWTSAADIAVIGNARGAAGTLTVTAPLAVGGLIFNPPGSGNYTLTGSTLTLATGSTITANANATINSTLVGDVAVTGPGTVTLGSTGAISYTGTTTVSNGATLRLTSPNVAVPVRSTTFFVNGPSTLAFVAQNREDIQGQVTFGSTGGGTVDFAGTSNFGGVVLLGSTLTITTTGGAQNRVISTGPGLNLGSTPADLLTFNTTVATDNLLVSTPIGNQGSVTKTGVGTATLTAANNNYAGPTTLDGGVLSVSTLANGSAASNIGASSAAASSLVFTGGTLRYTGAAQSTNRLFTLGAGGGTLDASGTGALNFTSTGAIAFSGAVPHALTLTGSNTGANTLAPVMGDSGGASSLVKTGAGTWQLTGTNTYTGGTSINGGTLSVSQNANLGAAAGGLTFNGGSLQATATMAMNRAIALNGAGTIETAPGAVLTNAGVGSGTGGLTKTGTGTLALTGASTYTGGTTITAGTLQLGAGGTTGSIAGDVVDNSVLSLNRSDALTLAGAISGTGRVDQVGAGTTTLTGTNTYTGGTTISAGVLQLGNGGTTGSIVGDVVDNTALAINRSSALNLAGVISGTGAVRQLGAGATTLSGANTYTGGTTISAGALQVSADNNLGAATGGLSLNGGQLRSTASFASARAVTLGISAGTFNTNAGTNLQLTGVIGGNGTLVKAGAGQLTLTGANTYAAAGGGTSITGGTLQVSANNNLGTATGGIAFSNNSTLRYGAGFASARNVTLNTGGGSFDTNGNNAGLTGVVGGIGSLTKAGAGTLTLTGANTYGGGTTVSGGTLAVNNTSGSGTGSGAVNVLSGGTLGGSGTIAGSVNIANGGTLAPGNSPGTLTTGALSLNAGSILNYEFGQASTPGGALNDLVNVNGNLTLAGTLNVATSAGGNFLPGVYRVFNYTGALTNNTLNVGTAPVAAAGLAVQTSVANQVNLVNSTGVNLQYWDGGAPANHGATGIEGNAVAEGGAGVWQGSAGNNNWTAASGAGNAPWAQGAFAVFQGSGGAVTVDSSAQGPVNFQGAQFDANGYVLSGGTLNASTPTTNIRVGAGGAGAGTTATIDSAISDVGVAGGSQLVKTDPGTLILGGANSYAGGTAVNGGVLQVAADNNLGATTGGLALAGGTLRYGAGFDSARTVTLNAGGGTFDTNGNAAALTGVVSGPGSLAKAGAGSLTLAGANSYSGGTALDAGTLVLNTSTAAGTGGIAMANGTVLKAGVSGLAIANDIATIGAAQIDGGSGALSLGGNITGAGALTKSGTGITTLTGTNTYSGGTTIAAGTLQLGNGGTTGSIVGDVANNGTLVVNRSNTLVLGGSIGGSGAVNQTGAGNLVLNGANTFTGGLGIARGTVTLGTNSAAGTGTIALAGGTTLAAGVSGLAIGNDIVTTGAATIDGGAGTLSLGGTIGGTGAITKSGTGTTTLTGTHTYSGGTTIAAGTLQLGNGGTTGSIVGDIVDNGTLAVDRSNAVGIAGTVSGTGSLRKLGSGTLTLAGANTYSGGTALLEGRLDVGHGSALGTGALAMSEGTTLGFTVNGLTLANPVLLTGTTDPIVDTGAFTETLSGAITGSGALTKNGSGTLIFSGANSYTGATNVSAGTLLAGAANSFSAASAHTVAPGATLDTGGFNQGVASLLNGGTVSLPGAAPGATLTVTGAYVGNAGLLKIGTAPGNGGGVSDRLVLDGPGASATGHTTVQVTDTSGLGAPTSGNGINVITALGGATTTAQTTKDAFALAGGHVDAGAFEYRLYAADATGAGDNWYLRTNTSTPTNATANTPGNPSANPSGTSPTYRADVPLYAALPNVLRQSDLAMLSTLHRRVGDEGASTDAAGVANRRAWGRAIGGTTTVAQTGTTAPGSRIAMSGFQTGVDLFADGSWNAGLYVGQLRSDARVSGLFGLNTSTPTAAGSLRADHLYLGGYATVADRQGRYADFVLQYGVHGITGTAASGIGASGNADSLTASAEAGQRFALGNGWGFEPQAQLIYNRQGIERMRIGGATTIAQDAAGAFIARLGVRVTGDFMTGVGRLQPYARLNLWHGFRGTDNTSFIGPAGATAIPNGIGYTSTEVAAGFTLALTPAASLYGEAGTLFRTSVGKAQVKSSVMGSVGVRLRF